MSNIAVATGNELGSKLVKLFGLPKYTKYFELIVNVNEAVTIKCEYYPEDDILRSVDLLTAEFELKEIEYKHKVEL
jgi:hypothetical protein